MGRLLVVSNRLPVTVKKRKQSLEFVQSVGGLATGLGSFYDSYDIAWIGWPGIASGKLSDEEREQITSRLANEHSSRPVFLSKKEIEMYYQGFCNKTIWPLFHYFIQNAVYSRKFYEYYKNMNVRFFNSLAEMLKPGDTVWVHDYHLMLLPEMIREKYPSVKIGFFLHIPFPSYEVYRCLPWRRPILRGLLGSDIIGFHTNGYAAHFADSVRLLLGHNKEKDTILAGGRKVKVKAFPMGIDYEHFSTYPESQEVKGEISRIRRRTGDRRIILSIDRLDYTKGIINRLVAFDLFLKDNPKFRGNVTLFLIAVPSRTAIESYKQLKKQLDELVGRINGRYGSMGWTPVCYMYKHIPFRTLVALYNIADVGLVTPLRDGMNLIAKEFVATKTDGRGMLILSELAGAAHELGEAIIVNPNNKFRIAEAIEKALTTPEKEQIERNGRMQERLKRHNIRRWARDFIENMGHS